MISMTEIINWVRNRSDIYIVHNSAFKPYNLYFNNLQAATDFFNTLILFIGVHHSSDEEMMGSLYQPRNSDFSTLKRGYLNSQIKFWTGDFVKSSFKTTWIDYYGQLKPPYNDSQIKGPNYRDYIGIWKGRGYLPQQIKDEEAHYFNTSSQITFLDGWWLETINGTYEISLGKINIDE